MPVRGSVYTARVTSGRTAGESATNENAPPETFTVATGTRFSPGRSRKILTLPEGTADTPPVTATVPSPWSVASIVTRVVSRFGERYQARPPLPPSRTSRPARGPTAKPAPPPPNPSGRGRQ